jgi:hypothetical protein
MNTLAPAWHADIEDGRQWEDSRGRHGSHLLPCGRTALSLHCSGIVSVHTAGNDPESHTSGLQLTSPFSGREVEFQTAGHQHSSSKSGHHLHFNDDSIV